VGQTLVPGPAEQRAGQQRNGARREPEVAARSGQQGCAEHMGEAGQGEDQTAQQAPEQADPPGVVEGVVGFRVAARHAGVERLGEGEGVLHAVAFADLLVREAVGLQQGGYLVRVDGGGHEVVEVAGEFVDGVGAGPGGCRALPGDGGQPGRVPAHQSVPSVATAAYQGSRSSRVQSATVSTVGS